MNRLNATIVRHCFLVLILADLLESEVRTVLKMRQFAGGSWQENGLLFPSQVGTPLEERNVLRRFQAICEANGLPKLRLYDLRHTHASLLIHEGVHPKKISERLGHSSLKLTMDTYGHLFEGSDRDSAEKMEKLFGESKVPRVLTMPARNRVADKNAAKKLILFWSHPPGSNRRPADYESAALPAELGWPVISHNFRTTSRRSQALLLRCPVLILADDRTILPRCIHSQEAGLI
jgi:hypothetical protein